MPIQGISATEFTMEAVAERMVSRASERQWHLSRYTRGGVEAMLFRVALEQAEDGWIVAECPALPGCVSQGRDEKEALENIKEAISAWMWAEVQKAIHLR
jgi:predicted RNase H-like HicB family nuclease